LPLSTPLELVDLGAQRLMTGPQLDDLALQLSHQGQQVLSTQGVEGFALNHGLQ
jgi:hypothetical protein